jgi:hypothetical protein
MKPLSNNNVISITKVGNSNNKAMVTSRDVLIIPNLLVSKTILVVIS